MGALAKILAKAGKVVGGCDRAVCEDGQSLIAHGITISEGQECDLENYQVLVYTDAVSEENPTLIAARRLNMFIISRGLLLQLLCEQFKTVVAVAGCHGKTTCTAMLAHILGVAKLSFSSHIGGYDLTYSNGYSGGNDIIVTEACEYKKNFLYLKPDIAVVLNSDADHLDCYGTAENLQNAYKEFCLNAGEVIKLYGDLNGADGVTFGFDDRALYYAKKIRCYGGKYAFCAYEGDYALGEVRLEAYGKHNVLNALAAIAAARRLGIQFEDITAGLKSFCGVKRRFENIGSYNGAVCIADYAHHPNEIRASLKTARYLGRGQMYVVFQPHTYSRTKTLYKQFVTTLSQVKRLMVYKTFAAREYYDDAGSALTLSKSVKHSVYGDNADDIKNFLACAGCGDVILFLGAGDIYEIAVNKVVGCKQK